MQPPPTPLNDKMLTPFTPNMMPFNISPVHIQTSMQNVCVHQKTQSKCMLCWELGVGGEDLCRMPNMLNPTRINLSVSEQERINALRLNDLTKQV